MNLLILGVEGYLGQLVVSRLMRHNPFRRVFGIGRTPPPLMGPLHFITGDAETLDLGDLIITDDVQVVLNLAGLEGDPDGDAALVLKRLLEVAEPAGVRRVVQPSRDWIYAPSETPVLEKAPLRDLETVEKSGRALIAGAIGVERAIADWRRAAEETEVVVLRMATVLGPTRSRVIDAVLARDPIVGPPTGDPWLQFLHAKDAATALIDAAATPDLDGPYNVAGDEPLRLSAVAGILEASVVHPPGWLVRPGLAALARLGATPFGPVDAARLHLGVPMATDRMRAALGPRTFSSRQALAAWRVGAHRRRGVRPTRCIDPLGEI